MEKCWQLHSHKLIGIGVNCSHPDHVSSLLKEASNAVPPEILPRVVYPNSGETWIANYGYESILNYLHGYPNFRLIEV